MLVITRKLNESFVVGDNVTVKVVDIIGSRVRIGVEAPKDIRVSRITPPEEKENEDGVESVQGF